LIFIKFIPVVVTDVKVMSKNKLTNIGNIFFFMRFQLLIYYIEDI